MKTFHLAAAALILFAFGCDGADPLGEDEELVSVALSVAPLETASKTSDHLILDDVRILLREIQFHSRGEQDSLAFRTDPLVAKLNLDGTPTPLTVGALPEGDYHKVSFRVHKAEATGMIPDLDFRTGTSDDDRYSVIVEGSMNGQPFVYRSRKAFHQHVDLNPDLSILGTQIEPIEFLLQIDLSRWFVGPQGEPLNPIDPSANERSLIDRSIRGTFQARQRADI